MALSSCFDPMAEVGKYTLDVAIEHLANQ